MVQATGNNRAALQWLEGQEKQDISPSNKINKITLYWAPQLIRQADKLGKTRHDEGFPWLDFLLYHFQKADRIKRVLSGSQPWGERMGLCPLLLRWLPDSNSAPLPVDTEIRRGRSCSNTITHLEAH